MPLRATRDGGATWPSVLAALSENPTGNGYGILGYAYVGFTDDKHGFALGGAPSAAGTRQIHMTSDGGRTWSTYTFS